MIEERRDAFDVALAKIVLEKTKLSVLGICGGAQLINIALDGALVQDIAGDWATLTKQRPLRHNGGASHVIDVEDGSLLLKITGEKKMKVNSFHHQAIDPFRLGCSLKCTAKSADGIIEAVELVRSKRFLLGLQWHPERMLKADSIQRRVFEFFVQAARAYRSQKIT